MPPERIRFQGDPIPGESGSGREPEIPLNRNVPATSVEMLPPQGDETGGRDNPEPEAPPAQQRRRPSAAPPPDDDPEDEAAAPAYSRENIGARVGLDIDQQAAAGKAERDFDTEDCKACLFPTNVKLQHAGLMHEWAPGLHLVPVSIAGADRKGMHWWLKRNKVRHAGAGTVENPRKPEGEAEPDDE